MKYQTADYIRSLIYAISVETNIDDYGCSCIQRQYESDHWECHLYSKTGDWQTNHNMLLLAMAITQLVPALIYFKGRCDIGPLKGQKVVDSVVIW